MRKVNLTVVPKEETVAQRVLRLQQEARDLAREHIGTLIAELGRVRLTAHEIATGGDAYPPGIRDLALRTVEDCEARYQTLEAILNRVG